MSGLRSILSLFYLKEKKIGSKIIHIKYYILNIRGLINKISFEFILCSFKIVISQNIYIFISFKIINQSQTISTIFLLSLKKYHEKHIFFHNIRKGQKFVTIFRKNTTKQCFQFIRKRRKKRGRKERKKRRNNRDYN